MAGDIFFPGDGHWAASSSTYNWVLDTLIDLPTTPTAAAAVLTEIRDANLGIVDLADDGYFAADRGQLLATIADQLVPHASQHLPAGMPGRDELLDELLDELRTLADLATNSYQPPSA